MTTSLPEGIITNTDTISGDIEQVEEVTVEDVYRLWKVYTTNKHVLRRNSGRRLENLFWRIWSNRARLCRVLSGATVARLFNYIADDQDAIIRTTPVASPRERQRRLNFSDVVPRPGRPPDEDVPSPSTPQAPEPTRGSVENPPPPLTASASSSSSPPPPPPPPAAARPPILKKRSRGSEEGKEGRAVTGREIAAAGTPTGSSRPNVPSPLGEPPTPPSKAAEGPRRKRTTFVVSTASSSRRKPMMRRRKSSQSSTGGHASSIRSATTTATTTSREDEDEETDADADADADADNGDVPSDPVGPSEERADGEKEKKKNKERAEVEASVVVRGGSRAAGPTGSSELVPRRRDEGRPRVGLFTTFSTPALSSLARGDDQPIRSGPKTGGGVLSRGVVVSKTSATLASTSTAAQGRVELGVVPPLSPSPLSPVGGKGKASTIVVDGITRLKEGGGERATTTTASTSSSSSAIQDEREVVGTVSLPRSKSQLSLVLERDRDRQGGGAGGGNLEEGSGGGGGGRIWRRRNRKGSA